MDLLQVRNVLPAQGVEVPRIRLRQEHLNSVHCSSDIFRCTLTKIPETNSILQKSRLPLGVLIHPFKDLTVKIKCNALYFNTNKFKYYSNYRLSNAKRSYAVDHVGPT